MLRNRGDKDWLCKSTIDQVRRLRVRQCCDLQHCTPAPSGRSAPAARLRMNPRTGQVFVVWHGKACWSKLRELRLDAVGGCRTALWYDDAWRGIL